MHRCATDGEGRIVQVEQDAFADGVVDVVFEQTWERGVLVRGEWHPDGRTVADGPRSRERR